MNAGFTSTRSFDNGYTATPTNRVPSGDESTANTFNMHNATMIWAGEVADKLDVTPEERATHERRRAEMFRGVVENGEIQYPVDGVTIAGNLREMFSSIEAVGSDVDNLSLSDRRAEAVAVALTEQFQVPAENLVTQGYGEQYLKIPTQGPEEENRRVAIRRITPLMGQVAPPPGPR